MKTIVSIAITYIILMVILCIYVFIPEDSKEPYAIIIITLLATFLSLAVTDEVIKRIKRL